MDRYKDMAGSKGKMFMLQHCYKLLEHSEEWKIRDREAPPARGALIELDDEEEKDEINAKKNKKRPNGVKKKKDKLKKQAESSSIRDKMDDMMKSREHLVNKTLETKVILMEKKSQKKQMRWELLREDEKMKAAIDERRARAKEKCAMAEIIAEENKIMMIDSSKIDEFTKEWWNLSRMEILKQRREAVALARGTAATTGGGDGVGGGGGAGGDA
jgi:hypothetical protein